FLILVDQYNRKSTSPKDKDNILKLYLDNAHRANNWDLVDLSCYKIIGKWLVESNATKKEKLQLLDRLANSSNLWEQRISIVSTMATLKAHDASYTLRYAKHHLNHKHDLMHKAVGWLLREMGKRCSIDELRTFLKDHAAIMPRTTLRYAIERMDKEEREYWMKYKSAMHIR
ncbi:MAG: DNA alkylation repair protein, partial [Bacteroidales bacterium]|nr:DNA alkylation repair protein [Candidatus Sodaliphilus fimicaballi]